MGIFSNQDKITIDEHNRLVGVSSSYWQGLLASKEAVIDRMKINDDRMGMAVRRIQDKIREVTAAIDSGEELEQETWNKGYKSGLQSALSELDVEED